MNWTPDKLAKEVLTVTSLPTVYIKLVEKAQDPNSSSADFVTIISEDIGLSARLMKLVNSAFFGYPSRIDSLSRAVAIVGTKQLQDLALATSIFEIFKDVPTNLITMESFWKHSIGCGVVARILANYRREFNIERAFVSGLLLDIGRLVMFMAIPDITSRIFETARNQDQLLYQAERQALGFTHAHVGGALLKHWRLPEQIVHSVKYHHSPIAATRYKVDTALVHTADVIITALSSEASGEIFVPPPNNQAWEELGLSVNIIDTLLIDFEQQYRDAIGIIMTDSEQQ